MGLAYLAAVLQKHDLEVLDLNIVSGDPLEKLKERIADFNPDVAGISLRNIDSTHTSEVIFYYELLAPALKVIREAKPEVKIIVGGPGFSIFAGEVMKREPEIDYGVFLEGEESLPELLENLASPENVKGIYYRKNGSKEVLFTGTRPSMNFGNLPVPAWGKLKLIPYTRNFDGVGIQSKRGCVLNCAYCTYPFLNGKNLRLRSPESVADEVKMLVEKFKIPSFIFVDSVFNIPIDHASQICEELIRRELKVEWEAWFNEKNTSKDFFKLARRAGCKNFTFSPDGFTDKTLEMLQKNITQKDILRVIDELSGLEGINVHFNFFLNPPGQSLGGIWGLFKLRRKIKQIFGKRLRNFGLLGLRIEPYTPLREIALKQGLIDSKNDLLFPVQYKNPESPGIERMFEVMVQGKKNVSGLLKKLRGN